MIIWAREWSRDMKRGESICCKKRELRFINFHISIDVNTVSYYLLEYHSFLVLWLSKCFSSI